MSGKKELTGGKANNTGSPHVGDDILLKTKPEKCVRVKDVRPTTHRVELQTLYLNKESENQILETLKHIHGPEFSIKRRTLCRDKGNNLNKQYWIGRGNLVVQGGVDYSAKGKERSEINMINMFAISKLERYGFHKSHCLEALDASKGDVGTALEILQNEYFNLGIKFPSLNIRTADEEEESEDDSETDDDNVSRQSQLSKGELQSMRDDEQSVLESIFGDQFEEKIANRVWVINLDLEYLHTFFNPVSIVEEDWDKQYKPVKKVAKPMCSYFAKGACKYGQNCKYSHRAPSPVAVVEKPETHLFQLEIRFGEGCKYPAGVPFIFITTTAPRFPTEALMRISHFLLQEAKTFAEFESSCIYQLAELLLNEHGKVNNTLIEDCQIKGLYLDSKLPLFPPIELLGEPTIKESITEAIRSTKKQPRLPAQMVDLLREDDNLARRFQEVQQNGRYKKLNEVRRRLPAWLKKEAILHAVRQNQVVVISGETGCGKSTQVPQYLLDDWLVNRAYDNHVEIVCTQPRRISAIGVAERVAEERAERAGNTVGYQIRLESKISSSTRLTFCTLGILLRRLESDPTLANVSHIIVDEVHERSEESDFLLLVLRDVLPSRPDLKVILMSATLNAELFSNYFGGAPMLEIPGRTFDVDQYFLEDIFEETRYAMEENSTYAKRKSKVKRGDEELWEVDLQTADLTAVPVLPKAIDENLSLRQMIYRYKSYSMGTIKSLYLMDPEKINYDLIEVVIKWIVSGDHDHPRDGSILVFLPGIGEITTLYDQLYDHPELSPRTGCYELIPLHSSLSSEDQAAVFRRPKEGCRKIVLSTNIAETSVTIDDCVYVIDCGKMKEKRFDSNKNMESLEMTWVSRANALQRKGRAGRVMPGVCIHLFTLHRYEWQLLGQPVPELHRVPLEQLLLRVKTLSVFADRDPHSVLGNTIEPPDDVNIDSALGRLRDVGALDKDLELTPLGRHLAALPVDVRIGKLMLFGAIFGCLDSALTIAACLNHKSPFVSPFGKKDTADARKKAFATGNSDQLTALKAYKTWHEVHTRSRYAGRNYADENFLSWRVLVTLGDIKQQLLELLVSIGFVDIDTSRIRRNRGDEVLKITKHDSNLNVNGENSKLMLALLCAALYPNVVKILTPEKSFEASAGGAVPKEINAIEIKFRSKDDSFVFLHPSSINFSVSNYTSPYLVYQEKVKTSRIFIRDCSMAPMIPLILFSGSELKVEYYMGMFILALEDGWIKFAVETQDIAELLYQIRLELVKLLAEKIKDPSINLLTHVNGKKILATIVNLLS